ncbi:MAG: hypothetical protein ACR2NQ_00470 [Thermodesulfobacteriota bacterium]
MMKNLWILTEERPKQEVIQRILIRFAKDKKFASFVDTVRILPVLQKGQFTFVYEVCGFQCKKIGKILIKSVSGNSSFVDFLVFYQEKEPTQEDIPLYAIEETKTDDQESRNTSVYQRASKFVFLEMYYPTTKKVMLYNLQIEQKKEPTDTYIFGTRLLLTLGVEIEGKILDKKIFKPFKTVKDVISCKGEMKMPPKGNVPILINKTNGKITVSGRLFKSDSLSHDPNIGALSLISASIRKLGWKKEIQITKHGLKRKHLMSTNKFINIAHHLKLQFQSLSLPNRKATNPDTYWKYEERGEKLGTIFIHLVVENFTEGHSIFENHAGCEKGYFITSEGNPLQIEKYSNRKAYKSGDKSKVIRIPDLILIDLSRAEIINVEGKKYKCRKQGVRQLRGFSNIEKYYIKKHYPKYKIVRTVVLYGGNQKKVVEIQVGFLLSKEGHLVLGVRAPKLFKKAIKNLKDFWAEEN